MAFSAAAARNLLEDAISKSVSPMRTERRVHRPALALHISVSCDAMHRVLRNAVDGAAPPENPSRHEQIFGSLNGRSCDQTRGPAAASLMARSSVRKARLSGVGTPWRSPAATTDPVSASTSKARPARRSKYIEVPASGG